MGRHTTTIDPGIDPALLPAVRAADDELEHVLQWFSERFTARWRPSDAGPGRGAVTLELHDPEVTRTTDFRPDELAEPDELRSDLRMFVLDHLQDRMRIHRRRLVESLASGDGG